MLDRAAIDLGQALDVRAIAEGVEHPHQLAILRELGCPLGQGFLFAKPQPAAQAESLIGEDAQLPNGQQAAA